VIPTEVSPYCSALERRQTVAEYLVARDDFFFFIVAGDRLALKRSLWSVTSNFALVCLTAKDLLVAFSSLHFSARTKRCFRHVPVERPRAHKVIQVWGRHRIGRF